MAPATDELAPALDIDFPEKIRPGGMQSVGRLYDIDVGPTVIDALVRRR